MVPPTTKAKLAESGFQPGILSGLLRVSRERAGVKSADMARRLGCHPSVIMRIESGEHWVSESTLVRWAAALGLSVRVELQVPDDA